jgi:hypothetical protein
MQTADRVTAVVTILIGAAVLAGCASTKVVGDWRDEVYTGRPVRVLVMGVTRGRGPRTLLEEEFLRQYKDRRVDAVAGTTVFPAEELPKKEEVIAKAQELRVDAVLVVRFMKKTEGETHTPVRRYSVPTGFATSWDEYVGAPYDMTTVTEVGVRDVSYDYSVLIMETVLFDQATSKPVWSAMTNIKYQDHPLKKIKPFAETIMQELDKARLLPKR